MGRTSREKYRTRAFRRESIFDQVDRELARDRRRPTRYFAATFITAIVVLFVLAIIFGGTWMIQHIQWDFQNEPLQFEGVQFDTQFEKEQNDWGAQW